jgi:hypothetical protein
VAHTIQASVVCRDKATSYYLGAEPGRLCSWFEASLIFRAHRLTSTVSEFFGAAGFPCNTINSLAGRVWAQPSIGYVARIWVQPSAALTKNVAEGRLEHYVALILSKGLVWLPPCTRNSLIIGITLA